MTKSQRQQLNVYSLITELMAVRRMIGNEEAELMEQAAKALSAIYGLIGDDAYAASFQSMGQYRTALLKTANP